MAKYTLELRQIVDNGINIFDFPYDFFDETKKQTFQDRFIKHFYLREIGFPTVGRFIHYLQLTFTEKLPYYNELFRTAKVEYDKLNGYRMVETYTKNNNTVNVFNGESDNTVTGGGTDTAERKQLNTPQGNVSLVDTYLTNAEKDTNTTETTSTGNSNTSSNGNTDIEETMDKTIKGNIKLSDVEMIQKHIELQKTLQTIEQSFFEECSDLFMLIY